MACPYGARHIYIPALQCPFGSVYGSRSLAALHTTHARGAPPSPSRSGINVELGILSRGINAGFMQTLRPCIKSKMISPISGIRKLGRECYPRGKCVASELGMEQELGQKMIATCINRPASNK